jgi:tetratricopeptide (TPR) repeat protein
MNQLQKYLNGQMEAEELEAYTERLIREKYDEERRVEWSTLLLTKHGVKREPPLQSANRVLYLKWASGVAASLLLIVAMYFLLAPSPLSPGQQLADQYLENLPIMADQKVMRKGGFQEEVIRIKANEAFIDHQYESAIELWTQLAARQKANGYDQFYLGISYLKQSAPEPGKAITQLQAAKAQNPELSQEADWVLALAYVKSGHSEEARTILENIVASRAFMSTKAEQLLRTLDSDK